MQVERSLQKEPFQPGSSNPWLNGQKPQKGFPVRINLPYTISNKYIFELNMEIL